MLTSIYRPCACAVTVRVTSLSSKLAKALLAAVGAVRRPLAARHDLPRRRRITARHGVRQATQRAVNEPHVPRRGHRSGRRARLGGLAHRCSLAPVHGCVSLSSVWGTLNNAHDGGTSWNAPVVAEMLVLCSGGGTVLKAIEKGSPYKLEPVRALLVEPPADNAPDNA